MQDLAADLKAGNRRALARAITLVESSKPAHRLQAEALQVALGSIDTSSLRIGLSGAPGVGKSTFIEAFGLYMIAQGMRVAVLAVDPSSSLRGGSILGDKTRMERLSKAADSFIRPSPSGGSLGGVARRTREAMSLCEAAGYDVILVETVGVGQSETAVADMTDLFLLLQSPGGGDELQGIKRGIMELVDILVVNKADGDFLTAANHAASDYRSALSLMRPKSPAWNPQVVTTSALNAAGLDRVWELAQDYRAALVEVGLFQKNREDQLRRWLWQEVEEGLKAAMLSDPGLSETIRNLEASVSTGKAPVAASARDIIETFLKRE